MNLPRASVLVLALVAAPLAFAQWQWIDKDGRKVFSDQAPPPGPPADKVLKRPGGARVEAEPAVQQPAVPPLGAAAPKLSGKDKELEAKRKAASAAEAEKKQAQDEEIARSKADNCERAKRAKATLESGVRVSTTNAKGEREVLDDNARAAETRRL